MENNNSKCGVNLFSLSSDETSNKKKIIDLDFLFSDKPEKTFLEKVEIYYKIV